MLRIKVDIRISLFFSYRYLMIFLVTLSSSDTAYQGSIFKRKSIATDFSLKPITARENTVDFRKNLTARILTTNDKFKKYRAKTRTVCLFLVAQKMQ